MYMEQNQSAELGEIVTVQIAATTGTIGDKGALLCDMSPNVMGRVIAIHGDERIVAPKDIVMYEPYIKEKLGIPQSEKLRCMYEKTCGAVLYTEVDGKRCYLLIENDSGHIGFPKGHIELNETEEETAVREIFEETGIKVSLERNFRMQYQYFTREEISKRCIYFMAHYNYAPAKIQESEILQSWLVSYREAMALLNFAQDREILETVEKRLR